jgi:hypothetical protein
MGIYTVSVLDHQGPTDGELPELELNLVIIYVLKT